MEYFVGLLIATSLMMVAPTARSQSTSVDTQADVQKTATAWMDAYNKKDAATIAKMCAEDAVFSNPGWTVSGQPAIEETLNKDIAGGAFGKMTSITVEQAHRVGDLDYSAGSWTADAKPPDGKDVPVGEHWLAV